MRLPGVFLNDKSKNSIAKEQVKLSKIFLWYGADFKNPRMSKIDFINQYAPTQIDVDAKVEYMDYNWNLNE